MSDRPWSGGTSHFLLSCRIAERMLSTGIGRVITKSLTSDASPHPGPQSRAQLLANSTRMPSRDGTGWASQR